MFPSTSESSTTATPSSVPSAADNLAELAQHPCRALDDEDANELAIFIDGSEADLKDKSCEWGAGGGLVSFTPYPSTDKTADKTLQHLTRKDIGGRRALLGTVDRGPESAIVFVAAGRDQSFRIMATSSSPDAPGPAVVTLATSFARAILEHLR